MASSPPALANATARVASEAGAACRQRSDDDGLAARVGAEGGAQLARARHRGGGKVDEDRVPARTDAHLGEGAGAVVGVIAARDGTVQRLAARRT